MILDSIEAYRLLSTFRNNFDASDSRNDCITLSDHDKNIFFIMKFNNTQKLKSEFIPLLLNFRRKRGHRHIVQHELKQSDDNVLLSIEQAHYTFM